MFSWYKQVHKAGMTVHMQLLFNVIISTLQPYSCDNDHTFNNARECAYRKWTARTENKASLEHANSHIIKLVEITKIFMVVFCRILYTVQKLSIYDIDGI